MTDDEFDGLPYPNRFLAQWPTWLVASVPRPAGRVGFIESIRRVIVTEDGEDRTTIPAFTDRHQAEEFVSRLDDPAAWEPVTFKKPEGFIEVLRFLSRIGETHILFDTALPRDTDVTPTRNLIPIPEVIRGVLTIRDEADSAPGG